MQRKLRIFTDSASDLDFELSKKFDINLISLKYECNNIFSKDRTDEKREENLERFYDEMKSGKRFKTAQANPFDCSELFKESFENNFDVIYICCSSKLSGTYNSALIGAKEAQEKFPDRRIAVIDSLCVSLGQGFIAIEAAKKRDKGLGFEDILDFVEFIKLRIVHLAILNDLDYIKSGGRISSTTAFFGSVLGIKPVVNVDNQGYVRLYNKFRGRKKALDFFMEKLKEEDSKSSLECVLISYNDFKNEVLNLEHEIHKELPKVQIIKSSMSVTLTSHTGLGSIAIFYMSSNIR